MKKNQKLKIAIVDIGGIKNKDITDEMIEQDFLYNCIKNQYNVAVDQKNPDLVISYSFGRSYLNYDCLKLLLCHENRVGNPDYADLALTSNEFPNHTNHFKVCFLPHVEEIQTIRKNKYYTKQKTKFCSFIYSNKRAKARVVFCKKLMKYKKVDCLGRVLKNAEEDIPKNIPNDEKQQYIYKDYKFSIAFENSSDPGYLCEKILEPLSVGTVPIYWGAPDVGDYINPECFINVNDFDSFDAVIEYIKKVDNDPKLYQKYVDANIIAPNSRLYNMNNKKIEQWINKNIEKILSPDYQKLGKISFFDKIKFNIIFRGNLIDRRLKQLFLSGAKIPLWEKIFWMFR